MPTTRLTDIQKNQNYLELVYQHVRNASKKFQKDISSRTGDMPLSNFGKKVSKQTDWQTYMKFRIICSMCTNIPGISPKKIRKISHPELEISLYLSNFSKEVSQLTEFRSIGKCVPTSQEYLQKNWKDIWSRSWDIPIFV